MEGGKWKPKATINQLLLQYGSDKHLLPMLHPSADGTEPTIKDLAVAIQQLTEVPVESQKLTHRGQSLSDMNAPFSRYKIERGSKIILLGNKAPKKVIIECEELQLIAKVENSLRSLESQHLNLDAEIEELEKEVLMKTLKKRYLEKVMKEVQALSEDCMKKLETLDGISLKDKSKDVRAKRKVVINQIQTILDKNDALSEKIDQRLSAIDKKDDK